MRRGRNHPSGLALSGLSATLPKVGGLMGPARFRSCGSLPKRSAAYSRGNARWFGRRHGQAETEFAPVLLRPPDIRELMFGEGRGARGSLLPFLWRIP